MNCRRIEELMPLFVEGDLPAEARNEVSLHLHNCEACSQLVSEYSASQTWLRSYDVPEFGNAFYRNLQQSVMREIEQNRRRPTWLQRLQERWQPKLAFALAVAMLILVGSIASSIFKGSREIDSTDRLHLSEKVQVLEPHRPLPEPLPEAISTGSTETPQLIKYRPRRSPLKPALRVFDAPLPVAILQSLDPLEQLAVNIFDNQVLPEPLEMEGITELPVRPTSTRIELQTNDPSIRIIWFAPIANRSQSSKIDTE
jgi:hypothetical protein